MKDSSITTAPHIASPSYSYWLERERERKKAEKRKAYILGGKKKEKKP